MRYVAGVERGDEDIDDLWLVGLGSSAAYVVPVGVLAVFVEVEIHIVRVVIHGGVLARVQGSPVVAEFISHCLAEQPTRHCCSPC